MTQELEERRRVEGINPKVLEAVTLDDINVRLAQILRTLEAQVPDGVVEPDVVLAGPVVQRVDAPHGRPWFSVEVINDGPGDITFTANTFLKPLTIGVGEDRVFDMGTAAIEFFTVQSPTSASVRYVGTR